MASEAPLSGMPRLFGAYLLLEPLGRGAMGDVHLARPLDPQRGVPTPVVVKRLHGELALKPDFVARFRHEAALAVSVDSPHVAKVFDVGAVDTTLYIVMEYVSGWPLSDVLQKVLSSGHHAPVASVVELIAGGLEGLDALHTAVDPQSGRPLGIVHRDISPKNLMVGEDGKLRLIDLGLGKSNNQDWRTRTGVVMGSVGYMPPEQAAGDRVDHRADIYAMGAVAYEMLALRNYIKRGTMPAMMESSLRPAFVPPSKFRPDIPPALDRVLERALKPDRQERFESTRDFLDALRAAVPQARTAGTMAALLNDLFGAELQARAANLMQLLALGPPEEVFESQPTRVFVLRAGVARPEALPRVVRPVPALVPDEPAEATRATELYVENDRTFAVPRLDPPSMPPRPMGYAVGGAPPPPGLQVTQGPRGVSLPGGGMAVLVAAALGGVVAVLLMQRLLREGSAEVQRVTVVEVPAAPAAPTTVSPVVAARSEPSAQPEAPQAPPPSAAEARVPSRSSAQKSRPPAAAEPAPPPRRSSPVTERSTAASHALLNDHLGRLERTARALKAEAPVAQREALMQILVEIPMWKQAEDLEKKQDAVRSLEARLATLAGG